MTDSEIKQYIHLGTLVTKIEAEQSLIESGDLNFELEELLNFPFQTKRNVAALRKDALREYYRYIFEAFYISCKIFLDSEDETTLKAVESCISKLIQILGSCPYKREKALMVKPFYNIYVDAFNKLKGGSNPDVSSKLQEFCKMIFKG